MTEEIRDFMARLGLENAGQMAALLRNPGADYPSPGLIRTYLGGLAEPSAKFCRLLAARRAEIESQLTDGLAALEIAGRLHAVYYVSPKRHLIPLLSHAELERSLNRYAELAGLQEALAAGSGVPAGWLAKCAICGQPFIARTSRSRVCYRTDARGRLACRCEARRRVRAAKRKVQKQEQKANERAARKAAQKGG